MKSCLHMLSLAVLLPLQADGEEIKVLSVSPDKKIEVFTKGSTEFLEEARPHARDRIIGEGIFARFVGSDSPECTLGLLPIQVPRRSSSGIQARHGFSSDREMRRRGIVGFLYCGATSEQASASPATKPAGTDFSPVPPHGDSLAGQAISVELRNSRVGRCQENCSVITP